MLTDISWRCTKHIHAMLFILSKLLILRWSPTFHSYEKIIPSMHRLESENQIMNMTIGPKCEIILYMNMIVCAKPISDASTSTLILRVASDINDTYHAPFSPLSYLIKHQPWHCNWIFWRAMPERGNKHLSLLPKLEPWCDCKPVTASRWWVCTHW